MKANTTTEKPANDIHCVKCSALVARWDQHTLVYRRGGGGVRLLGMNRAPVSALIDCYKKTCGGVTIVDSTHSRA